MSTTAGEKAESDNKDPSTQQSGKNPRNQDNQTRQPKDDQIITGPRQGAMGQGERGYGESGTVTREDRYRPENNPARNPEPVTNMGGKTVSPNKTPQEKKNSE